MVGFCFRTRRQKEDYGHGPTVLEAHEVTKNREDFGKGGGQSGNGREDGAKVPALREAAKPVQTITEGTHAQGRISRGMAGGGAAVTGRPECSGRDCHGLPRTQIW